MFSLSMTSFILFLLYLSFISVFNQDLYLAFNLFPVMMNFITPISWINWFNSTTQVFSLMLLMVMVLVYLYSENYMEHYNNKKFIILLSLFVVSMFLLIFSGSSMNLMLGWDYLGVTSICLIMIYPNKFTLMNSFLTMIFNRLGDVFMILLISLFLINSVVSFHILFSLSSAFMVLAILCSLAKSAQFPLSSWLPAAMSAPTPVSSMVHSSTLVTAGIYLVCIFVGYMSFFSYNSYLCMFAMLSFLCGGLMAIFEPDLKKVVAFSTMSQISMIIFFCSVMLLPMSLMHMFFHASFKSLLFCCAGSIFMANFLTQLHVDLTASMSLGSNSFILLAMSCFGMSGLIFSSSFFTKDQVLEILHDKSSFLFLLLLLGSIFSILYISKVMTSCTTFNFTYKSKILKRFESSTFLLFGLVSLMMGHLFSKLLLSPLSPLEESVDFLLTLFSLLLGLTILIKPVESISYIVLDISMMKTFSFSFWSKIFYLFPLSSFSFSDHLFFKPSYLSPQFSWKDLGVVFLMFSLLMTSIL